MIHNLSTRHTALPLFILLLLSVSFACNSTAKSPSGDGGQGSSDQSNSNQEKVTVKRDIGFGPGTLNFPDMTAGLSDLSSYTATLIVNFNGTHAGNPEQWSKTYVMQTIREPAARQLTIEKSGNVADANPVFMAELDGINYEKRGQTACNAVTMQEGSSLADRFEPVSFLGGVIGAEEAGSDTVNEVAANHYTFDQRALGEEGVTESTGELWVASEGGYLVKYVLTRNAKADYFGEGIEGIVTLDYELTDVNQDGTAITIPDDCPPGLVDAPLLPDATNVTKTPGRLEYQTSSSVADAAAFYQQQIPAKGWTLIGDPAISDSSAFLNYQQGNQDMIILITTANGKPTVTIMIGGA